MRTILAVPALVVLLLGTTAQTGGQADMPMSDKELIQGTWAVFAVEFDGRALPDGPELKRFQEVRLTFKGDTVLNSRDKDVTGRFTLDSTKKPGQLDIVTIKEKVEHKMLYVYHVDSDTLELCFTRNSDVFRPRALTSDNGQIILFFKRQKSPEQKK